MAYDAVRKEFASRYGQLSLAVRNWQRVCAALVVLNGLLGLALVLKPPVERFIVRVDQVGAAVPIGTTAGDSVSEQMIRYQLREWIVKARSVRVDESLQAEWTKTAQAWTAGAAREQLNTFYSEHNPILESERVRRTIEAQFPVRLGASASWRLHWIEAEQHLAGNGRSTTQSWEAIVTVETYEPKTSAELARNPLGIRITDLSWQSLLRRSEQ